MSVKFVLIVCVVCLAIGFTVRGLFGSGKSEFTEWDVALINAGTVKPNALTAVMALPSRPIITDSAGNPAIARYVLLKVKKDGEPYVAVYYEAKAVLLNNLPKLEVDTTVDTTEVKK